MTAPTYEVFAIKYAERDARRPDNFVGGDPHDVAMPMNYFIWLVCNDERLVLVNTGFDEPMAVKRGRRLLRKPIDALKRLGVAAADVRDLAASMAHIVPGHDPLVFERYPAVSRELEGIAVRLDVAPK